MKQEIKERIELINKGIVPAGYKKTPVGICPVEWEENTLKNIFIFKNGLNKEKSAFGKGTPIINYTDVWGKRGLKLKDVKGKVTLNKNEIENYSAKKGDVFFTRTSETINEIGLTSVLLEDIKDCVFSGFVLRGRPISNLIVNEYNQYCYSLDFMRNEITKKSSYTTRALTNGELLSQVLINLPTKSEQQKIAEILDCATRQVELQEQLVDKLKVQKKALMQKLLTPQPDWQEVKLGDICEDIYQPQTVPQKEFKNNGYKVYGANGFIGFYDKYNHKEWQVVLSCRGDCGTINKTEPESWINGNAMVLKIEENEFIDKNYFYYQCLATSFKDVIDNSGIPQITRTPLLKKNFRFIENMNVQKKLANIFINIDKRIELQQKLLEQYKLRQIALMQLLLTGIVRVG